jgi:hypothetical protein
LVVVVVGELTLLGLVLLVLLALLVAAHTNNNTRDQDDGSSQASPRRIFLQTEINVNKKTDCSSLVFGYEP